ncbi:Transposase (class III) [alpha proteobacterium BAL199]|nr:Transposase (class III) [alpha proteobacterium BAL199]
MASADITYIPMRRGFLYLVAIMDWATRKVLAWRLSNTMDAEFCIQALEEAVALFGVPEIFNTDQGSQFTSPSTPSAAKRSCQRQTAVLATPASRMIALVPRPAAVSSTIRQRQTCFCGLLRSATIASRRARSAVLTVKLIPVRMPQTRTPPNPRES